jgi:hypothetical protein
MISHLDFMEPSMPKNPPYRFAYHDRPCEPRVSNEDPEGWCEIASYAEEQCEELFAIIVAIAHTGCSHGVCANSLDVCRDMRAMARAAIESYGRPVTEESSGAALASNAKITGPGEDHAKQ